MEQGTTAVSTLTVRNRCSGTHEFQIDLENVPFLLISQTRVSVEGGKNNAVPVRFDTNELDPGLHQGAVIVVCVTCPREPTCTQDKERLLVNLNVTGASGQVNNPDSDNPQNNEAANLDSDTSATNDIWGNIPVSSIPQVNSIYTGFKKNPCPELEEKCKRLREAAARKESEATDAQAKADEAKKPADAAEQKAKDAEKAAKNAADAADPAKSDYKANVNGQEYSSADVAYLEVLRGENNSALAAGTITVEEHQRRAKELTAKKAREERLAKEAKLKEAAEKAKNAADKARSEADRAKKEADRAQADADKAKKEADKAIGNYQKCIEKLEEECRKKMAAIARAEQERKEKEIKAAAEAEAAAAKKRQEEERLRQEEQRRIAIAAEDAYLLDNIKRLGLIDSAPFKDVPGAFDALIDKIIPDILGKTAEAVVNEMVTGAAEYTANNPIPISSIQAIGGLYQIFAKRLDPCSPLGAPRIALQDVVKLINPKTGRNYTSNEAENKVDKMCKLLKKLKDKLNAVKALQDKQGKK